MSTFPLLLSLPSRPPGGNPPHRFVLSSVRLCDAPSQEAPTRRRQRARPQRRPHATRAPEDLRAAKLPRPTRASSSSKRRRRQPPPRYCHAVEGQQHTWASWTAPTVSGRPSSAVVELQMAGQWRKRVIKLLLISRNRRGPNWRQQEECVGNLDPPEQPVRRVVLEVARGVRPLPSRRIWVSSIFAVLLLPTLYHPFVNIKWSNPKWTFHSIARAIE